MPPSYKKWLPIRHKTATKAISSVLYVNFVLRRHCQHICLTTELKNAQELQEKII